MTNKKQQTAVEWLYIELSKFINGKSEFTHKSDILIKAKEMEKQQIVEAYRLGHIFHDSNDSNSAQEYYDTEYGKETSNN